MPLPATWRSWLNWIGCSRATRACGDPGRAVDFGEQAEQAGDEEDRAEDADPGDRVGAAMKDLRHRLLPAIAIPFLRNPVYPTQRAALPTWSVLCMAVRRLVTCVGGLVFTLVTLRETTPSSGSHSRTHAQTEHNQRGSRKG